MSPSARPARKAHASLSASSASTATGVLPELVPGQSIELLKALHILTRDGKLNQDTRRKLKQVQHLVQFIAPLIDEVIDQRGDVTLADHGAHLAFASDWPVSDVNPMRSIQAALTRVPYEGATDERVGLEATLRAYTAGGAWAAHLEGLTGTLRPGLAADLVLIDGDIEAIPAEHLGRTGIALTISGGRVTHDPAGLAKAKG